MRLALAQLGKARVHIRDEEIPVHAGAGPCGSGHLHGRLAARFQRHFLKIIRDEYLEVIFAAFFFYQGCQRFLSPGIPMNQDDPAAGLRHGQNPVQKLTLPRMGGKPVDGENLRGHGQIIVEQAHTVCAVYDFAAQRAA